MRYYIVIPTYNGGEVWRETAAHLKKHCPKDTFIQVIDSNSSDSTVLISREYGFSIHQIDSLDFNHGGTRNLGVKMHQNNYDVVIFITQDAFVQKNFLEQITKVFEDPEVACAYGRQLPHIDATFISQHARYFNYREESYLSSLNDKESMGIKTVFLSNSFAAYRISLFNSIGGFPDNTILSEDMYFAAKSVLAGYKIAYCAESMVRHSHNYSVSEEFKRYFDIGVFHADQPWIRKEFGGAGGEGKKFIISEFFYLMRKDKKSILKATANNFFKLLGYKLGLNYKKIPKWMILNITMHKRYWK